MPDDKPSGFRLIPMPTIDIDFSDREAVRQLADRVHKPFQRREPTMPETTHSPLPWTYLYENDTGPNDEGFAEWYEVLDAKRNGVARVHEEEDAAIIVRACNAHDAMLAALRRQVANVERWLETGVPAGPEESREIYEQMKAAIAKAEEPDHA